MLKHWLHKVLPKADKLHKDYYLQIFGKRLHSPNLWHINRQSVATAFSVGLFCAFMPIPLQMLLAAAGAIVFSANLPLSVVLVWVTNPVTIAPIFYFTYKIGAKILNLPIQHLHLHVEFSYAWWTEQISKFWKPLLLGCFISAICAAVLGNIFIRVLWRIWISVYWHSRKHRNSDKTK